MDKTVSSSLEQGYSCLQRRDFGAAYDCFNEIIGQDSCEAEAYWGRLLAVHQCANDGELIALGVPIGNLTDYHMALSQDGGANREKYRAVCDETRSTTVLKAFSALEKNDYLRSGRWFSHLKEENPESKLYDLGAMLTESKNLSIILPGMLGVLITSLDGVPEPTLSALIKKRSEIMSELRNRLFTGKLSGNELYVVGTEYSDPAANYLRVTGKVISEEQLAPYCDSRTLAMRCYDYMIALTDSFRKETSTETDDDDDTGAETELIAAYKRGISEANANDKAKISDAVKKYADFIIGRSIDNKTDEHVALLELIAPDDERTYWCSVLKLTDGFEEYDVKEHIPFAKKACALAAKDSPYLAQYREYQKKDEAYKAEKAAQEERIAQEKEKARIDAENAEKAKLRNRMIYAVVVICLGAALLVCGGVLFIRPLLLQRLPLEAVWMAVAGSVVCAVIAILGLKVKHEKLIFKLAGTIIPVVAAALLIVSCVTADRRVGTISIASAEDFYLIGKMPSASYRLTADIDFGGSDISGMCMESFKGSFDGNGHIFSNFKLSGNAENRFRTGIFGNNSGSVCDLAVKNVTISPAVGNDITGSAVIASENSGSIKSCSIDGCVVAIAVPECFKKVGAISGENEKSGTISECTVSGLSVTTQEQCSGYLFGGIAGNNIGSVDGCSVTGDVDAALMYCGLITAESSGTVSNCTAEGSLKLRLRTSSCYAGGITGSADGRVSSSFSDVQVTMISDKYDFEFLEDSTYAVGGAVGISLGGTVSGCASTGKISLDVTMGEDAGDIVIGGKTIFAVGGFIGRAGGSQYDYDSKQALAVSNCLITGDVQLAISFTGKSKITKLIPSAGSGVIGFSNIPVSLTNCLTRSDVSIELNEVSEKNCLATGFSSVNGSVSFTAKGCIYAGKIKSECERVDALINTDVGCRSDNLSATDCCCYASGGFKTEDYCKAVKKKTMLSVKYLTETLKFSDKIWSFDGENYPELTAFADITADKPSQEE